jgi:hypothetical protein
MSIERLGTLVWDAIAELSHRGETRLDPDSAQCAELRRAAYLAAGKAGDDRRLAFTTLEWLQGVATFDAVLAASEAYEKARIKN